MQIQLVELLRRKRDELSTRHAAVLQEAQAAQQQVVALAGAIAGIDEMLAELPAELPAEPTEDEPEQG